MIAKIRFFACCMTLVAMFGCATAERQSSAPAASSAALDKERELIGILNSKAPPADKAIACKQLTVYGTEDAVPALAKLLSDKDLASWSRIALEQIPGPSADAALREAMGKLQGRLLIGTINSIAYRRDAKAVSGLAKKLNDSDADVASAAALALGRIGGADASKHLQRALAANRAEIQAAVAEGCVLCAEHFLLGGKSGDAMKLYDLVRAANVPKHKILEATRGAILARGSAGIGLLLEQLRSPDKELLAIGLHTARELPGYDVTADLKAEVNRSSPDRQSFLLIALADRKDPAVFPMILEFARSPNPKLQLVAVGILDRMGKVESMPALLKAAAGNDADVTQAALAALARLPGNKVDEEIVTRLPQSSGKMRQVLIQVAGQRQIEKALPAIVESAGDSDAGIRAAAVQALGAFGGDKQAADLANLVAKTQGSKERADIETALVAIGARSGASCVQYLLPLAHSEDSALRTLALHTLASAGGADALTAVKLAVDDTDEGVQDEAVRTLETWPNNWPDDSAVAEPLLALAKSGKKPSHQVLGARGYLQYVKEAKQLKYDQKVEKVNELLPLLKRPEEKRLAIATLDATPTPAALDLLSNFAAETDFAEDASAALLNLAGKNKNEFSKEQRQKALQLVVNNSKNDETKKKAEKLLKEIQ